MEFPIVDIFTEKPQEKRYNGILLLVRLFYLGMNMVHLCMKLSCKIPVCAGIPCFGFKRSSGLCCGIYPGEQSCCKHVELSHRTLIFCRRGLLELPGEKHASEGII